MGAKKVFFACSEIFKIQIAFNNISAYDLWQLVWLTFRDNT